MEFFRQQFNRISQQLGGLSASQKMLCACLVAIMVMTLVWWSHYAATPDMTPILNQSMTQSEIGVITASLDTKGIPYTVSTDRVLVASDRKMEALASLTYSQALPKNFDNAFDDIVKQSTGPFTSPDVTSEMFLKGKEGQLSGIISALPGVSSAMVLIDPTDQHRFDGGSIQPSAMVTVTTLHGGENLHKMAEAAAALVSGAQAGLTRSRINIVIDGQTFAVQDPGDTAGEGDDSIIEARKSNENYYRDKVMEGLNIRGLLVSVAVKLNTADTSTISHTVSSDPKQSSHLEQTTDEQTSEATTAAPPSQEAGASANIGFSVAPGGNGGGTTTSDSKTTYTNDVSKKDETVHQGPGDSMPVSASVRVPHSWFVASYKMLYKKDPDDASIGNYITEQLKSVRDSVKVITNITSDELVIVNPYMDTEPVTAEATSTGSTSAPIALVSVHAKEIGLGGLAALSMFMMFMMVRKGAPAPLAPLPAGDNSPQALSADHIVAGSVTEGNAMLDGMEMDEDSVKAQQMLDQVQQMVQTNPDGAAGLVKRWLNRS